MRAPPSVAFTSRVSGRFCASVTLALSHQARTALKPIVLITVPSPPQAKTSRRGSLSIILFSPWLCVVFSVSHQSCSRV